VLFTNIKKSRGDKYPKSKGVDMLANNKNNLFALSTILMVLLSCTFANSLLKREETAPPPPLPLPSTEEPVLSNLNADGPYVAFKGMSGIWITNPDGSYPTKISDHELQGDLRQAISPNGDQIAYTVKNEQGIDLVVVDIPSGDEEKIAHLISVTSEDEVTDPTGTKSLVSNAIRYYDNVSWQPGTGRYLAFVGALNGPTADLYLYDRQTQSVTQLTDSQSYEILPRWSPGGEYILYYGVSWIPPFGASVTDPNQLDGVWSVRISDGQITALPNPKTILPNFVGWQDNLHFLTFDGDDNCYARNLRSINVETGDTTPVIDMSFYYQIAHSPENGALLFSSAEGCADSLGEGVFVLLQGQANPSKILEKRAYEIHWLPESKVFNAYPEGLLTSDGNIYFPPPVYDASYHPAISAYGYEAWTVIENQEERVVVNLPGSDWRTIMEGSVEELIWNPVDPNNLLIATRDSSLYSAYYPDFTPRIMGNLGGIVTQAIWIP
jgi:hypothetical protein